MNSGEAAFCKGGVTSGVTVATIAEAMGLARPISRPSMPIHGLCTDSRQAFPGALFFAVPGASDDGSRYIREATRAGAVAVARDRSQRVALPPEIVDLPVQDVRKAKARAAHYFYRDPSASLSCVGITGTNGKTTTASILHSMLCAAGHDPTQIGTTGLRRGDGPFQALGNTTPDPLQLVAALAQARDRGARSVVMEASSHALVQRRLHGVRFAVAVFTQLSREHLDYHRDVEDYLAAKALLFEGLSPGSVAVINAEDPHSLEVVKRSRASVLTYGLVPGAHVRARKLEASIDGSSFEVLTPQGVLQLRSHLPGRHNVMNVLAAVASAQVLGVAAEAIQIGLSGLSSVPGRLEALSPRGGVRVLVDYAHTDDALEKVLHALRPLTEGRLITVFGCGGDRDRAKRSRMGRVAAMLSDFAIVTNDNPRSEDPASIAEEVLRGVPASRRAEVVLDRKAAIECALVKAREGDVVLVAGKGHECVQVVGGKSLPFDDRRVTQELLCRICG